jgi:hypothetical protein
MICRFRACARFEPGSVSDGSVATAVRQLICDMSSVYVAAIIRVGGLRRWFRDRRVG